jgi:hypothetical protein
MYMALNYYPKMSKEHVRRVDVSKLEVSWISSPTPPCLGSGQGNPPHDGPSESGYAPSPRPVPICASFRVWVIWCLGIKLFIYLNLPLGWMFLLVGFPHDHHLGNVAAISEHTQSPTSFAC